MAYEPKHTRDEYIKLLTPEMIKEDIESFGFEADPTENHTENGINIEKMKSFLKFFDEEIYPAMKGEDGKGLEHLREVARLRRLEVENKKEYREKILAAKEDKNAI